MIGELRRLSLRHFARYKVRVALTVFGIALGVATIVAVRILLDSVTGSYDRMVDRIAGKAALQVVNGEGGVPEELLEEVRRVPGVAGASPSVFGWLSLPDRPGSYLFVFGVDLVSDSEIRDYDTVKVAGRAGDPLAFVAEPDSIAVTTSFLAQTGLELGGRFTLSTAAGPAKLTIRSALDVAGGPASLFGGWFALMDIFAAQPMFGLDRRFTQIDLRLEKGADLETVEAAVARVVGGRGAVERPAARGLLMDRLLAGNRTVSTLAAMMSITVGLYLVFETMMIAVAQRRREIGILRSVGMSRRGVIRLIFAEALLLGIVGSLVGVPLGLLLAHGLAPALTTSTLQSYFLSFDVPDVSLRLGPVAWGVALAITATLVAAVLPAREAVVLPPLEALRRSGTNPEPRSSYRVQAAIGASLMLAAVGMWLCWRLIPLSADTTGTLIVLVRGFGLLFIAPWV
ncbi:MAG: FtsX-like permease family protein, partial [Candidatus Binatia bacterium]